MSRRLTMTETKAKAKGGVATKALTAIEKRLEAIEAHVREVDMATNTELELLQGVGDRVSAIVSDAAQPRRTITVRTKYSYQTPNGSWISGEAEVGESFPMEADFSMCEKTVREESILVVLRHKQQAGGILP